jgi:hypothetical protein
MTQYSYEQDAYIHERLYQLKRALPRDFRKASIGRERYLIQVADLVKEQTITPAVSNLPSQRHNGWIGTILNPLTRKERFSMFTTVTTILVAITMLFGGAGATVFASQGSLPDDLLYPVKTFSEDAQLMLTQNPQSQLDLLMAFTDRRMGELQAKNTAGEPIPEALVARFHHEMNLMFRIAAGMEEPLMNEALGYIGIHVRKHDRDMERTHTNQSDHVDPLMEQVREILRVRVRLAELGLEDPLAFRNQVQQLIRVGLGPLKQEEGIKADEGYGPGQGAMDTNPCQDCQNDREGNEFGPGLSNQGELTQPEDGYGPGPQDPQECNCCQQESGKGAGGSDSGSTNQGEESLPDKPHEQNSDPLGPPPGSRSPHDGVQPKSNSQSGSSK